MTNFQKNLSSLYDGTIFFWPTKKKRKIARTIGRPKRLTKSTWTSLLFTVAMLILKIHEKTNKKGTHSHFQCYPLPLSLRKHHYHLHILLRIFHLLPSHLWFLLYLWSAMKTINISELLIIFITNRRHKRNHRWNGRRWNIRS